MVITQTLCTLLLYWIFICLILFRRIHRGFEFYPSIDGEELTFAQNLSFQMLFTTDNTCTKLILSLLGIDKSPLKMSYASKDFVSTLFNGFAPINIYEKTWYKYWMLSWGYQWANVLKMFSLRILRKWKVYQNMKKRVHYL